MKAEELRIGNLVYHKDEVHIVNSSTIVYQKSVFKCYPIELTPEWLERAGFDDDKRIDAYSIESNDKCYFIRKEGSVFWVLYQYNGWNDDTGEHISSIQYVHQLQNLIFALTGTELTFNQP